MVSMVIRTEKRWGCVGSGGGGGGGGGGDEAGC